MNLYDIYQLPITEGRQFRVSSNFELLSKYKLLTPSLIVTAGHSSSCKTTYTTQLAIDLLRYNTDTELLIYSYDDSIDFLKRKLLKQLLNNTKHRVEAETLSIWDAKLFNFVPSLDKNLLTRIHIHTSIFLGTEEYYSPDSKVERLPNDIVENIREVKSRGNNCIVIIDYLQMIDIASDDYRRGLNDLLKWFKSLQTDTESIFFVLSQLSKDGGYRETTEIRNLANTILLLSNNVEYLKSIRKGYTEDDYNIYNVVIEKSKTEGRGKHRQLQINSNYTLTDVNISENFGCPREELTKEEVKLDKELTQKKATQNLLEELRNQTTPLL